MIATALKALIHTDRAGSTAQFVIRTGKLASAMNLKTLTSANASRFYDLRSSLAHGQGIGSLRAEEQDLYVMGEDLLRAVLSRSILDNQFAATFADDLSIKAHWA